MAMYAASAPAFERQRSFSSSGNVVGATTAPPARTIYGAYPTPASPYPAYARSQPQRVYGHADLVFPPAAAPCNCTDCYSTGNVAPHYFAEPYASTSSYVAQPPLQYPANAFQPYPPADQPVYRPIPIRAESAYSSYAALPTPSLPSPPLEDQLPVLEPLSYSTNWVPTPAPSPPHFVPPSSYAQRAPSYELPTLSSLPPTPAVPSTGLLAPFSLEPNLDRRRSSGGSSVHDSFGASMSRRPSVMSLGSPFCGSERSFGSAHGSDENDEARQDVATPFTKKLQMLLNCLEHSEVLRWNADGTQFVFAKDTQQLSDALSQVFRHGSTHSFVRQLNIYSFKRLTSLELHTAVESNPYPGSPLTAADFAGFAHPLFFRDAPGRICDLTKIKPKQPKKPSARNTSHTGKARPSPYEPVTVRTRALRSDVKLEGIAKVQKI